MKQISEKVEALLAELLYCDLRTSEGVDKARKAVRISLKEQDRDTRYACAESVLKGAVWNDSADCDVVCVDFVYSACINVKTY